MHTETHTHAHVYIYIIIIHKVRMMLFFLSQGSAEGDRGNAPTSADKLLHDWATLSMDGPVMMSSMFWNMSGVFLAMFVMFLAMFLLDFYGVCCKFGCHQQRVRAFHGCLQWYLVRLTGACFSGQVGRRGESAKRLEFAAFAVSWWDLE